MIVWPSIAVQAFDAQTVAASQRCGRTNAPRTGPPTVDQLRVFHLRRTVETGHFNQRELSEREEFNVSIYPRACFQGNINLVEKLARTRSNGWKRRASVLFRGIGDS